MDSEARFTQEAGKLKLTETDRTEWEELESARNKAFHAFHYEEFIREVNAMETILRRYPQYQSAQH